MAKLKRRQPYDPSKPVHDRRATDLLRNAMVAEVEVDDPYGQPGEKIATVRNIRSDPLAWLHSRRSIDEAQYQAGRAFQDDFERIEGGAKAVDPSQPYVDCSRVPRGVSMAFSESLARLNAAHKVLGEDGSALAHDVLIRGWSYRKIASVRGYGGERWENFFGMAFNVHLHKLAFVYGFAKEPTGKQRNVDN